MAKNLIPIIAKELGVEIGEEFKLTNYDSKWRFVENNLQFFNVFGPEEDHGWLNALDATLKRVITGELKIIKFPFKPELNETYWTYSCGKYWWVCSTTWCDSASDYCRRACGCAFRSKQEALAARPAKYEELTGKEWIE